MNINNSIAVFQGKNIRRKWHNHEWWFSVFDLVSILADSTDPKQYVKKMRSRDPILNANWGTICTPLELLAPDGKKRKTSGFRWNVDGLLKRASSKGLSNVIIDEEALVDVKSGLLLIVINCI